MNKKIYLKIKKKYIKFKGIFKHPPLTCSFSPCTNNILVIFPGPTAIPHQPPALLLRTEE